MRAQVFVPGHISCTFRPVMGPAYDTSGSLGFGIRLNLGCRADVQLRDDDRINIKINGKDSEAAITRAALELMGSGRGMDARLEHDLPLEQGFGSSASGTYAATLALASLIGSDPASALDATHRMEFSMGGGLGDLLAIDSTYGVPVRTSPGLPGRSGRTEDSGLNFSKLSLAVFDEPLNTGSVLRNENHMKRIVQAGDSALEDFRRDRTIDGLFKISNRFSESIGLESEKVKWALGEIRENGFHAGMCMLGNSIYTDAPMEFLQDNLKETRLFSAASNSDRIVVTRTE